MSIHTKGILIIKLIKKVLMSFFFRWRPSSFTYLNTTQFLAALNDNIYKLLVVYFFIQLEGIESSHTILAITGAIFVLPFLLFSASSGTMADRFSKRNIIVLTKTLEFVVLALGVLAFQYESKWGAYGVLFLMATLSAIFGPSKYGILPELVSSDKISKANGLMTSFTFLAIILGTFSASFLLDITNRHFIFAALFSTFMAFIAMAASFCIEYTPPSGSSKRFNILFIGEIVRTLKNASAHPSLLTAIFGSAFFMFLGAFVQLNMIPFALQALHLTDVQGGYLFLLTALGIGSGCILAGKISGKTVELGLVPVAGIGVAISCYLLDLFSDQLFFVLPLVMILGLFGGIYQIPLDSYIQVSSPNTSRGQIVAATNFLSFFGVLCSSGLLYLISEVLGFKADKGFTIVGTLTLIITIFLSFQFFDYLTRFIAMVLSKLHFKTKLSGLENIPDDQPVIFICTHTAWNDTLLLLGAQRRRMRFFIQQEMDHHHAWIERLYRMLRIVTIPSIEPLENNTLCIDAFKKSLQKGVSVCIFVESLNLSAEIEKLKLSHCILSLQAEGPAIIPVVIEKGEKISQAPFLTRMLKKFRVPAEVSFG
jgi:acyl-[acyl-carrier-protein]-phospholipid O-acyltransferase/long-chain-fatty-acid--[acyl-carrier-protein] ligase